MILSHRHRFIFIKTRKTGGTSVELALSEICGPDDVITPVSRPDERLRKGLKPQNHLVPLAERRWDWPIKLWFARPERDARLYRFWPHMSAREIRERVGPAVFDGYLKVTVERNPWDREVSSYHWVHRSAAARPDFETFVLKASHPFRNFDKYSLDGRIVADVVLRHDRLADDFAALMARLGVDPPPALPGAKTGIRPKGEHQYRSLYTDSAREAVRRMYQREIDAFGFEF